MPEGERAGYRAITSNLQRKIEAGEIASGSYLPTERELRDAYATSRTTVRRALASLVETGWAEALPGRGVIASRGYRPMRHRRIAFIDSDSPVARLIRERIEGRLLEQAYEVVHFSPGSGHSLPAALRAAMDGEMAAAFVWPYEGFPDPETVTRVCRQMPVISLDHRLEGAPTDLVTFDYEQAAFEATSHLIGQGCRRIGIAGMLDMLETTNQRFRGYLKAMFAHGLQPLPKDFLFFATSGHDHADPSVLETRFRSGDRPDGVFVMQDSHSADLVAAALRSGLSLPGDLKLATLGDDFAVTIDRIGLTTVAFDWLQLADLAQALLEERLQSLHRPAQVRVSSHRLVVRGLSGAPREKWTSVMPAENRSIHEFTSRWDAGPSSSLRNPDAAPLSIVPT